MSSVAGAELESGWLHLDDQPLPDGGSATVPWHRWLNEQAQLRDWLAGSVGARIGVRLAADTELLAAQHDLSVFSLVIVESGAFADGRIFSLGRLIRSGGFSGELCARGDLLPDQLAFLHRCGFDTYELLNGLRATAVQYFYSGYYQSSDVISREVPDIRAARRHPVCVVKEYL